MTVYRAIAELILGSAIWGFGFVATRWTLLWAGPFWSTTVRFALALLLGLPITLWLNGRISRKTVEQALLPGLLLSLTLVLQTIGLQYTSVTKSSFITCLYVVFVPLIERVLFGRKLSPLHTACVLLAVAGMALITEFHGGSWNKGDLFTLLCSIAAAFHIMRVDRIAGKIQSPFAFNTFQTMWALIIPCTLAIGFEAPPHLPIPGRALGGLLGLAWVSTLLAFVIQIRAQKVLRASLISLFFLLESPFAAVFAFWIFDETMTTSQWIGAALIFASAFLATRAESKDIAKR